jgi:hypothetical protein
VVAIASPSSGAIVSDTIPVRASVSIIGFLTVASVEFRRDGVPIGVDASAPYEVVWNTTTTSEGSHTLTAVARDLLGVRWTSNPVTVTVSNGPPPDTSPPTVAIDSPPSGAPVSGTITVTASASDDVAVAGVQFLVDGEAVGAEATTAPYSVAWDTTTVSDGEHTLTARARDAGDNLSTSAPVRVTVANTAPPPGGPTRFEETAATLAPGGTWSEVTSANSGVGLSGDRAVFAAAAGATATFTFTGTGVSWIGFRCEICGIAEVLIDDALVAEVDTFSPTRPAVSESVWDSPVLAASSHTLTIRVTGRMNPSSSNVNVVVDALDVTNDGVAPPPAGDTAPPTVAITSPADPATVSGTITVKASATDDVGVAGVQFFVDGTALGAEATTAPYAVAWDTTTVGDGSHTLTAVARDAAGHMTASAPVTVTVSNASPPPPAAAFAPGDVFASLETGSVQWRGSDGTLKADLVGRVPGASEGIRFDAAGNLYVAHWCADDACTTGNTVEKFDVHGASQGTVGSGYNCNPHALAFDTAGSMYVGQSHCTGAVLKLSPGQPPIAYAVAPENAGAFWIDIARDGCTIFYTSWGPNVKRFDACTNAQLADFNRATLPGGETHGLRVLPDGGVLVSSGAVVARLDSTGALVQTYSVSTGEPQYWAGLDLVGDGTFWVVNYLTSNIYKFDLTTGAVRASFNTGTPARTVVDVGVSRGAR